MLNPGWPILGLLWLLLAAAPTGAARAAEPQPRAATNSLQAVDYALLPAGVALIRVVFTQPLRAPPGLVVNHHPINRIAFDFPDTVSAVCAAFTWCREGRAPASSSTSTGRSSLQPPWRARNC